VPNLTVVKLGPGPVSGSAAFNVFNANGTVDVILDEDGFYTVAVSAPPASLVLVKLPASSKTAKQSAAPKVWASTRRPAGSP
jgi:hypothetical protein